MKLYSNNEQYKLYQGNMLDMLEVIEPNTIDSIITDPPYELNFMGKGWDNSGIAFQPDTWKKCFDVLKPGGYLLAFGGSRTFHRIACAIEDAGFEIRDTIMWLYGSGFPKSMDISKSLDKRNGRTSKEFVEFGKYLKEKRGNISQTEIRKLFPSKNGTLTGNASNWELGKNIPTLEQYKILKEKLGLDDRFDWLVEIEEAKREVIGTKKSLALPINDQLKGWGEKREYNITIPATDLAKQWQGWGTALKPSFEPIIVARKPFKSSLVDNVIEYGVGGINIDECRVGNEERTYKGMSKHKPEGAGTFRDDNWTPKDIEVNVSGRFPANTILTYDETDFDEVCGGFPNTKSTYNKDSKHETTIHRENADTLKYGYKTRIDSSSYNDSGSASRYFYCAKASKKDRDEGLDNFEEEKVNDGRNTPIDNAFQRGETLRKNTHPTVKPTELMQYLVRLITPNGGTILDPFNGSGSTGKAVMYENRERNKNYKYIGIELTEEYLPISKARIEYVCNLNKEKLKEMQISIFDL